MIIFAELLAKILSFLLKRILNTGGKTWPGEFILFFFPNIAKAFSNLFSEVVFVVGTNGKTSTVKHIADVLKQNNKHIITNSSGANMLNGVIASIFTQKKFFKNSGYTGIFEVDEMALASVYKMLKPDYIILLNVVRDQLDRYGETTKILNSWKDIIKKLPKTILIANASDPGLYEITTKAKKHKVLYYTVPKTFLFNTKFVAGDSTYCPKCKHKLEYRGLYVSHMGNWRCVYCGLRPAKPFVFSDSLLKKYSNIPSYILINAQSVYLLVKKMGIALSEADVLNNWKPAFGRGEVIRKTAIFLGKNPTSWSIALQDIIRRHKIQKFNAVVFGLNNKIPDGKDISWIWDIIIDHNLPIIACDIYVYGDRAYDMAYRLSIDNINVSGVYPTFDKCFRKIKGNIVVLSNYTAMLEARKVMLGHSIL